MATNHSTRTYKNLYDRGDHYRDHLHDRVRAFVEEEMMNGRIEGYHPRELYLCMMDSLTNVSERHRDMARWDKEEEIMG